MSVSKLAQRDPAFADVVATGLSWKVLRWEVRHLYPQALRLIQQARNIASTMNRSETEAQGLLNLHTMLAAAQRSGSAIPWQVIKKRVLRSRPPFAASLDEMIVFVVARSGGVDGKFLQNIAAFFRNHVDSTRTSIPAPVYSALANFPHQFLALAIYQAAWLSPSEAVQAGVCKGISAAEINFISKSIDPKTRQLIAVADDVLATARSDLSVVGIHDECDSTRLCKIFARLDVSMARLVLNKLQGKSKEKLLTPMCVARQFVGDLL